MKVLWPVFVLASVAAGLPKISGHEVQLAAGIIYSDEAGGSQHRPRLRCNRTLLRFGNAIVRHVTPRLLRRPGTACVAG